MKVFLRPTVFVAAAAVSLNAQAPASLAIDGRANANPSLAARGKYVAVAWSAATATAMDVYAALSRDGGKTFAAPARVNDVPGDARVNSELPPRVALVAKAANATPDVVVVWTTKGANGTRLLSARSTDGAKTFGASTPVPGSDAAGSRGWQSVAVDGRGRVLVMWLDHREAAGAPMTHNHDSASKIAPVPRADPAERAALSKLYFAALDGGAPTTITRRRWSPLRPVARSRRHFLDADCARRCPVLARRARAARTRQGSHQGSCACGVGRWYSSRSTGRDAPFA
jgi:hypothetical protein